MQAGRMDRRITIQIQAETTNADDEVVLAWADVVTIWAEKVENRGTSRFWQQTNLGKAMVTFRFRWSAAASAITDQYRILYNGRAYPVGAPAREIGRREGIEVDCWSAGDVALA